MKQKMIAVLILIPLMVLMVGGVIQFVASIVLIEWLGLKAQPSLTLLYHAFQAWGWDRVPAASALPYRATLVGATVLSLLPVPMVLMGVFMKPKRELHGSTRFASAAEVNMAGLTKLKFERPDILLGKYKGKYLRWGGNEFAYLAAPTRSGKGVGFVIPNCLHYRDSMVVFDPKLENFLLTAGYRAKHGQKVFLFNPSGRTPEHETRPNAPLVSHRWNPMTYIRRNPIYTYKDAMNMANIFYAKGANDSGSSMFFTESAQKLFVGLVLYLVETEEARRGDPKGKVTLANLFRLTSPSNGQTFHEWVKEEVTKRQQQPGTRLSDRCETLLLGFANGNAKTGSDILATLTSPLAIFLDPVVEAATSDDDFYLDELRKQRMTIYLGVLPTETGTFSRLTNLFFSQLIDINVAQGLPENNPALKYQCLMMIDEFTALGVVPAIERGVSFIAGYELRLLIIFQSPSQITRLYTKEGTRTFFTNFGCQIVFPPRDQSDANEYSELIGYETFKARSVSRSQSKGGGRSYSDSEQKRAVMLPDELKLMPKEDCIISLTSSRPIYAQKIRYFTDPVFMKRVSWAVPEVPVLDIQLRHIPVAHQNIVAQYVPADQLANTGLADTCNQGELLEAVLKSLIPADSHPDYVQAISETVQANLADVGIDSMPTISRLLGQKAVA